MRSWKWFAVVMASVVATSTAFGQAPNLEGMDIVLSSIPKGPVALVNGAPVSSEEFRDFYEGEIARFSQGAKPEAITDQFRIGLALRCLRVLIEREILLQEAGKRKVTIPDADLQEAWDREWKRLAKGLSGGKENSMTEAEVLEKAGATREEALKELRTALLVDKMRTLIVEEKGVKVSDAEVKAFYDERMKTAGKASDLCHIKQIFVRALEGKGAKATDERAKARAKAEDGLKRLRSGQSFQAVAKAVSDEPFSSNGGDLGPTRIEEMPEFLSQAACKLKPGEVSEVVESEYGYHVIQLVEIKAGEPPTLEKSAPQIKRIIMMEKSNDVIQAACRELTNDEKGIETFLDLEKRLVTRPELMKLFNTDQETQ